MTYRIRVVLNREISFVLSVIRPRFSSKLLIAGCETSLSFYAKEHWTGQYVRY